MRLYIIRHADPFYEKDTITSDGHLEAAALAERLASEGIDRIFCSPLGRARDTMGYTSRLLDIQPVIREELRELQNMFITGTQWGHVCAWNIPGEVIFGEEPLPNHDNWHLQQIYEGLEIDKMFTRLKKNSDLFIKELGYERDAGRYRVLEPNEEKIAIFCHGGFGMAWIAHLLQIPPSVAWASFWLAPSSVTTIVFEMRTREWAVPMCLGLGDTSHLYKAGLKIKPGGIMGNFY